MVGVFSTPGSLIPYPCHALAPPPLPPFQAFAVWRWSNYLHDQCACRGKQPLLKPFPAVGSCLVFQFSFRVRCSSCRFELRVQLCLRVPLSTCLFELGSPTVSSSCVAHVALVHAVCFSYCAYVCRASSRQSVHQLLGCLPHVALEHTVCFSLCALVHAECLSLYTLVHAV